MKLLRRMMRDYLRPRVRMLVLMFLIAATISAAPYAFSFLGKWLVDSALQVTGPPKPGARARNTGAPAPVEIEWKAKTPEAKMRLLVIFLVVTLAIHLVTTGLGVSSDMLTTRRVNKMIFQIRTTLHDKVEGMDLGFFSREQVGQFMSRILDDAGGIPGNLTNLVINFFTQVAMLVLGFVLLLRLNPMMSFVVLAALPFYGVTCLIFLPRIKRNTEELRRKVAELTGHVVERVSNVTTIKNYGQEDREVAEFGRRVDENLRLGRRNFHLNLFFGTITTLITAAATLSVLFMGFLNIKSQKMQLGEVLAFYQVTAQLFVPISALIGLATVAQALQVLGQRVYTILDTPSELADAPDAVALDKIAGAIEFEGVSLQYVEGGPLAVSDVTLSLPAGKTVCLVGPTGCGKSTIITLLTRLYDPTQGTIKIDGIDIRKIPVRQLRRAVGNVLHDCQVFSGTIAENIAFGAPEATREQIETIAKLVGMHDWIASQPEGYDTRMGQGGISLDAEETVKLGFARALVTEPAILTIDDTYSVIDEEAAKPLRAAVSGVLAGRTVLITTSRLSICEDADVVVVMQKGGIVQVGGHRELLAVPGLYRRMYMREMGLEKLDEVLAQSGGGHEGSGDAVS